MTITEKYWFRPNELRHLRPDVLWRYFSAQYMSDADAQKKQDTGSRGFTQDWRQVHDAPDDSLHCNYDDFASKMEVGCQVKYRQS